jgi:hypothetical protein
MFRFLAKSALAAVIWRRYRRTIVSTLALFVSYFLISLFHDDYVDYTVSAGDTHFLWRSYLIKWGVLIGVTVTYYLYNAYAFRSRRADNLSPPAADKNRREQRVKENVPPNDDEADPFAEIRHKKRLKSRGDIAVERRPDD